MEEGRSPTAHYEPLGLEAAHLLGRPLDGLETFDAARDLALRLLAQPWERGRAGVRHGDQPVGEPTEPVDRDGYQVALGRCVWLRGYKTRPGHRPGPSRYRVRGVEDPAQLGRVSNHLGQRGFATKDLRALALDCHANVTRAEVRHFPGQHRRGPDRAAPVVD